MPTLPDRATSRKATGLLHPALVAFAALLAPLVARELRQDEASDAGDPWLDQRTSPLGKRAHCDACRTGEIKGARFHRRKWLARRSAIDAYIAEHGRPADLPPSTLRSPTSEAPSGPRAIDLDTREPSPDEVEAELRRAGYTRTAKRATARGSR